MNLLVIFVQFAFAPMMGGSDLAVNLHGPTDLLLVIVALIQMLAGDNDENEWHLSDMDGGVTLESS